MIAFLLAAAMSAPLRAAEVSASVADADGKPVEGAVVFVYALPDSTFEPPQEPAIMDQVDKELVPHVLPVLKGTKVRFPNKDNIHHEVYSFSPTKTFELPLYKGEPAAPVVFDKEGVVKLGCNIHDWMSGIILVLGNPYFAVTNAEGKTVVKGLPKGPELEFAVFHERLKGSVDDTRKTIHFESKNSARLAWKLPLKPEHKKPRSSDYK